MLQQNGCKLALFLLNLCSTLCSQVLIAQWHGSAIFFLLRFHAAFKFRLPIPLLLVLLLLVVLLLLLLLLLLVVVVVLLLLLLLLVVVTWAGQVVVAVVGCKVGHEGFAAAWHPRAHLILCQLALNPQRHNGLCQPELSHCTRHIVPGAVAAAARHATQSPFRLEG